MKERQQPPRFIYITGADGTGKSTQAKLLLEHFKEKGVKTRHLWLRYPNFFSLPFLVYARLKGMSWREEGGGVIHGYWDFRGSWLMGVVYPWVLLVDAFLASLWKVYLPLWLGYTVVCERYVLDMLVDLSLALGDKDVYSISPVKYLLKLLPEDAWTFILHLDIDTIVDRRLNLSFDHHLEMRLQRFQIISQVFNLHMISSKPDTDTVFQQIVGLLGESNNSF